MRAVLRKVGPFNVRALSKITALLLLLFGVYLLSWWVDFGDIVQPERVVSYLQTAGPLAPVVFIFLMVTAVVISPIPSWPLDVAAGIAFGVVPGTIYAVIGAELGALLSFLLARALGRDLITRLARADLTFCERCSDRYLVIFVFVSRLFPVFSFGLISYGAGLTTMSLWAFALATLFGMIPPTFAIVALGESLFFGEWPFMLFGLVMVAFFFIVPKLVDALLFVDRVREAHVLYERLLTCANDMGLYAEEIDPETHAFLGDFPQAFTHLALIQSATNFDLYEKGGREALRGTHADRARLGVEATAGLRALWAAFKKSRRAGRLWSSRASILPQEAL